MPGSIDDVEAVVFPVTGSSSRLNSNAALLFLFHKVSGCCAIVYLTGFVDLTGQLENTLGSGSLARVNVGENTNISVVR